MISRGRYYRPAAIGLMGSLLLLLRQTDGGIPALLSANSDRFEDDWNVVSRSEMNYLARKHDDHEVAVRCKCRKKGRAGISGESTQIRKSCRKRTNVDLADHGKNKMCRFKGWGCAKAGDGGMTWSAIRPSFPLMRISPWQSCRPVSSNKTGVLWPVSPIRQALGTAEDKLPYTTLVLYPGVDPLELNKCGVELRGKASRGGAGSNAESDKPVMDNAQAYTTDNIISSLHTIRSPRHIDTVRYLALWVSPHVCPHTRATSVKSRNRSHLWQKGAPWHDFSHC